MSKIIKIFYANDEIGSAQLIGRRTARIIDSPIDLELCKDAIVLLDGPPSDDNRVPHIKKVLYNPYCCRTLLWYHNEVDVAMLLGIFLLLGLPAAVVCPHNGDKSGLLIVSHHGYIDPEALAESIGIEQPSQDDLIERVGMPPTPSNN